MIRFESLNDRLSRSGLGINQFIQSSAPGEGYAFPLREGNEIILDQDRLRNLPIQEIQLEVQGPAICVGMTIKGRRVSPGSPYIETPRHLFGYELLPPIPTEVSETTAVENNYYLA